VAELAISSDPGPVQLRMAMLKELVEGDHGSQTPNTKRSLSSGWVDPK
jgi:hypothetical protein